MTAKQAVKARCRDCSGRECGFEDCALKGPAKSKGKVSKRVILAYCRWCLNGHPFKVCSSPDCAIYQYRKERKEAPKNTPALGVNRGVQRGFFISPAKKVSRHP
jgi:hypothetical protein